MPDRIAQEIRLAILRGDVRPGEALRQRDLAKRFGTSLIPVREALRCLERENLVSAHPYRGACVLPLSADEIRQVADLHHVIFTHLLALALPVSCASDADRAEAILGELEGERDPVRVHGLLWGFYSGLVEPAHRSHAVETLRGIWLRYMRYWPVSWKVLSALQSSAPTLRETVDAYRAKDLPRLISHSASRTEGFIRLIVKELPVIEAEPQTEVVSDSVTETTKAPRKARRPRP